VSASAATVGRPRWQLAWAATAVVCIFGFALVTVAIFGHGPLLEIDRLVARTFATHRTQWLITVLDTETSTAAFYPAALFLLLVSTGVALLDRSWRPLVLGVSAVALVGMSVATSKQVIGRSRLPFAADTFGAGGTSYPSGHTTTAVVVGGCVLLLFADRLSISARRWAIVGMVGYSGVTGFSRIYLHDHWFTDVLAGWLLGIAIVCAFALTLVPQPRSLEKPVGHPTRA
jgi:membrane-associated phospholipid phosphatase